MIINIFTFQSGDFYNQSSFEWETIVAAIIAAIVIIIGYQIQKKNDRAALNRENSKQSYLQFLNDFTEGTVTEVYNEDYYNSLSDPEQKKYQMNSDRQRIQARDKLLLFGSDKVINAYLDFIRHIDEIKQDEIEDNQEEFFNKILTEIRKEIYPNSEITADEISRYFNGYNRH